MESATRSPLETLALSDSLDDRVGAIHDLCGTTPSASPAVLVAPPLSTTRLADVTPRAVQWLWPGRIPLGKITTFDGDPGVGKSTILADLAARVSSGASMPDGSQGSQGDVIIMTAEDDPDDTIRPRVEAAGADLERVHVIDMDDGLPSVVDATDELIATIAYLRAQLLIVDPFATFAGTSTRTKNTQSTAQAMSRIKRAASDTGCAVVLVRHLNKDVKNGRALYRGTDSIAIIGTARSGLVAGTDPDDGDRRVLAVTKSNLAPPMQTQSLGYRIASVEGPAGDTSRVDWLGRVSWDADEIIGSVNRPVPAPARESATEWLRHLVAEGPVLSADVEAAAEAAGHSMRTVKRAKDAAGVESKKRSDGRWQYQRKGAS